MDSSSRCLGYDACIFKINSPNTEMKPCCCTSSMLRDIYETMVHIPRQAYN